MAPKMEPQPTGLPFVFGEKEVKRTMILKLFSNNQIIPAINNERMNHPHSMFTIRVISVCPHLMTKFCNILVVLFSIMTMSTIKTCIAPGQVVVSGIFIF